MTSWHFWVCLMSMNKDLRCVCVYIPGQQVSAVPAVSASWYNVNITLVMVPGDCTVLYCTGDGGCPPARRARPPDRLLPPGRAGPLPAERHQPGHGAGHRWVMELCNCNIDVVVWYSQYVHLKLVYLSTKPSLTGSNAEVLMGLLCKLYNVSFATAE